MFSAATHTLFQLLEAPLTTPKLSNPSVPFLVCATLLLWSDRYFINAMSFLFPVQ